MEEEMVAAAVTSRLTDAMDSLTEPLARVDSRAVMHANFSHPSSRLRRSQERAGVWTRQNGMRGAVHRYVISYPIFDLHEGVLA